MMPEEIGPVEVFTFAEGETAWQNMCGNPGGIQPNFISGKLFRRAENSWVYKNQEN